MKRVVLFALALCVVVSGLMWLDPHPPVPEADPVVEVAQAPVQVVSDSSGSAHVNTLSSTRTWMRLLARRRSR